MCSPGDKPRQHPSALSPGLGLGAVGWVVGVLLAVVVPAEEFEVGEVGGSAVGPVPDVMCFAVPGCHGAAGPLAVLVASDERFPYGEADHAGGASDVEDLAGAVGDDATEFAVKGEAFEGGEGETA